MGTRLPRLTSREGKHGPCRMSLEMSSVGRRNAQVIASYDRKDGDTDAQPCPSTIGIYYYKVVSVKVIMGGGIESAENRGRASP